MAVIPSFGNFAATPDLGGAFAAGARVAVERQQVAEQSRANQIREELQKQELAQALGLEQARLAQQQYLQQQQLGFERESLGANIGFKEQELNRTLAQQFGIEQGRLGLSREQIAQQAEEARARIGLGYEQIRANRAQAEMEFAARQAAQAQERLQREQQLEIERAYRQQQLGLQERTLSMQEDKAKLDFRDAFRKYAAQEEYKQKFAGLDTAGRKQLYAAMGPELGYSVPPGMFEEEGAVINPPQITEAGGRQFYTSRVGEEPRPLSEGGTEREPLVIPEVFEQGGQRFYRAEKGGKPIPIPEDQAQVVERMVWQTKVDSTRDDIDRLKEAITTGRAAYPKDYKPTGKAKEIHQGIMDGIKAQEKELEDLEKKLQRLLDSAPIKATVPSTGATTNAPTTGTNAMPRYTWSPTNRMVMPKK